MFERSRGSGVEESGVEEKGVWRGGGGEKNGGEGSGFREKTETLEWVSRCSFDVGSQTVRQ